MSVARHTAYNFIGAVVPIAVSLVTVPLYLKVIGLDRYGVLAICWLLVGYFGLFDFGLGRATAQKIATLANAPAAERNRIFWTAALLSSGLCLAAVTVFAPLATIGLNLMKLGDPGLRQEVNNALPLLIAAVPFGIAQSLLTGSLEGRREFFKINLIVSTGTIATAILPLLVAKWIDPSLPFLLGAALIARMAVLLLLVFACVRAIPLHRPRIASGDETRRLLHFGGWTTVTNVVGPLMVFIDRFAIGAVLSASAVALYTVSFTLVSQLVLLPAALAGALFPRLASVSVEEARAMSRQSILVVAYLLTPATLVILVGVGPFLVAWIGESAAYVSTPVAWVLLFGFWTNSLARIAFARVLSGGRPDVIAKVHLAEILPYLALLYFGMLRFGLIGAALAWSVRCTADAIVLISIDKVDRPALRLLILHGAILLAATLVTFVTSPRSAGQWLLLAALAALTAVLMIRTMPIPLAESLQRLSSRRNAKTGAAP
jgi:O-antigen/teichoic acid export membrane protein